MVFRPRVFGAENVPAEGPAILASNHLSYADWLFMPLTLPRRVTFVAKAEYFTDAGPQGLAPEDVLRRLRPGADRPLRRQRRPRARSSPRSGCSPRASCSASTPRAPARTTASSTAARSAWPGWRSSPRRRSSRSRSSAPTWSRLRARPSASSPGRSCASASRSTSPATRAWRTTATSCARSPTRSCTRSCGSPARSTSTCTPPGPRRVQEEGGVERRPVRTTDESKLAS